MRDRQINHKKNGFTLAELLVVVAIIGILVAVSIPIFSGQLEKAKLATCLANRRSLLAEVRVKALDSDLDQEAAFNALYSADQADYPCPKGGIFSWENGQIVCSVHDGTEEASSSTVNIGGQTVVITAEAIDNPEIGDRITYKQGDICFIDGTYYILLSGYKNMLVSSKYDSYKAWFTDAMVNMGAAVAVDTKSATPVSGNVTFLKGGSLCSYDNKIYVMDNTSGYISSKNISKLPVFGNVK